MAENKSIDIIKGAILLEHQGKALYESVVKTTTNGDVKDLFQFLVEEEERHLQMLTKQYSRILNGKNFDDQLEKADTVDFVLSKDIVAGIYAAGYEAAVIAAALDFEKKAVDYYSRNAEMAQSKEEKNLYNWFTGWEKGHMHMLAELDKEIKEKVWYDNNFWPLY